MLSKSEKHEIIAHQWDSLRLLWERCKPSITDTQIAGEIDRLFPQQEDAWSSGPEAWRNFNAAEQRVGEHLDETQLCVEYQNLVRLAQSRGAAYAPAYEAKADLFTVSTPSSAALDVRRATYQSLLYELQSDFIDARFRRRLRQETASGLFWLGIWTVALLLLPVIISVVAFWLETKLLPSTSDSPQTGRRILINVPYFGLMMAAVFGILGAYFSRVIQFQAKLATFGFDDVMNVYQWRVLSLRLLYGMLGAIIFYCMLRSEAIGGTAFPTMSVIVGEQTVTTNVTVGSELAKLFLWSFLAGFSERLVPDALERTEAHLKKE